MTTRAARPLPDSYEIMPINVTGTGDLTLISAVTGLPIQVWGGELFVSASVDVVLKHGSTAFGGAMPMLTFSKDPPVGRSRYDSAPPWKETGVNEAFIANVSDECTISGELFYTKYE